MKKKKVSIITFILFNIFRPSIVKSQLLPGVDGFAPPGIYRNRGLYYRECFPGNPNHMGNNINKYQFIDGRPFVPHCLCASNNRYTPWDRYLTYDRIVLKDEIVYRKYKHAKDFGVEGKHPTRENREIFKDKIIDHLTNSTTKRKPGTYRNNDVIHYWNNKTDINFMINATTREMISGWKASAPQRVELNKEFPRLGGGRGGN